MWKPGFRSEAKACHFPVILRSLRSCHQGCAGTALREFAETLRRFGGLNDAQTSVHLIFRAKFIMTATI